MYTIAAEHFSLTPSIKDHVENNLLPLEELLPKSATIRAFLSEPVKGEFQVVFKTRLRGRELVVRESNTNLYAAISEAADILRRRALASRDRRIHNRRMSHAPAL